MERALVTEYEALVADLAAGLTPASHAVAVEMAALPMEIRGFGPVKRKAVEDYRQALERLCVKLAEAGQHAPEINRSDRYAAA